VEDVRAFDALQLLALAVEKKLGALRRRVSVAFMFLDGRRFTIDTSMRPVLSAGVSQATDVEVLCNGEGLVGLINGKLEDKNQVLLCRGDRDAFAALGDCLRGSQNVIALRAGKRK
jgi:hypothetical protein